MQTKDIKAGTSFRGQLGKLVYIGRIKGVLDNKFVIFELTQLAPNKLTERTVLWPLKALRDIGEVIKISKNKYNCLKTLTMNDCEYVP